MRGFAYDLKRAFRTLLLTRWTTLAAVLILALGTGVNTSVLAVAYGILLRPLPYADPSHTAVIAVRAGTEGGETGVPATEFDEWRARLRTVKTVAAYATGEFTMRGIGEPQVARIALVKGDFFGVLGVPPRQGQNNSADRDGWVAVTESFARKLAGGSSPVGRVVTVGQGTYTISAVVPDTFGFPSDEMAAWLPASSSTSIAVAGRDARSFRLIARLKPGVTRQQAQDDATRVVREIRPDSVNPRDKGAKRFESRAEITPLGEVLTGRVRPVLAALVGAAVLVLLVACGNVASLFVGRAVLRSHDLAVRLALGASRWRLVRGVLAESLIVAVIASAVGVWIGFVLVRAFVTVATGVFPRLNSVSIDLPVLAASALVAFVITLLCGAAPALNAARGDFAPAFRGTASSRSRPVRRFRAALVVVQIALSVVLLAGAGLVVRTVGRLLDQAVGIEPAHALSLRLVMSDTTTFTATSRVPFVRQLVERVRRVPGVQEVGVGTALPPRVAPLQLGIRVVSNGRDDFQIMTLASVTPAYLNALGARLVRGRMFNESDFDAAEPVALLSESAAKHLSPHRDPVGRQTSFPLPAVIPGRPRKPQVVGIIADIKFTGLDSSSSGALYVMWPDLPAGLGYLVVRSSQEVTALAPALQRAVRELDPTLPVPDIRSLDDEILTSIADRRLRLIPAISFAVLALTVALLGLSAAMTRAVAERRRELAIRGALGASPTRTLRMILTEGAIVTVAGVAAFSRPSLGTYWNVASPFASGGGAYS